MELNNRVTSLFDRVAGYRGEQPSVGRKFQLLGLISETVDTVAFLKSEVLKSITESLSLDVDEDIDLIATAERVLQLELSETEEDSRTDGRLLKNVEATEMKERMNPAVMNICKHMMMAGDSLSMQQLTRMENEALSELSSVLIMIADVMDRNWKDEDYARLYEQDLKRFNSSPMARSARSNFRKWLDNECYGRPTLEDINDYVLSKLLRMFDRGVFDVKVSRMQRGKTFPGEIDFDQMDEDHKLRKSINKYYAAFRKVVDFKDGCLVPNPACIGRFFYASRKDENAKAHRNEFMKYMLKITLAQEELRRLREQQDNKADAIDEKSLNYFAPMVHLQEMLKGKWFEELRCDETYDAMWTDRFVDALMASEWRDEIARDWAATGVRNKRTQIKGYIVGLLKDAGVLKGSYDSIARKIDATDDARIFSRYMGNGKQQPYEEWVKDYISKD